MVGSRTPQLLNCSRTGILEPVHEVQMPGSQAILEQMAESRVEPQLLKCSRMGILEPGFRITKVLNS